MGTCGLCGGTGLVAAGGVDGQLAGVFGLSTGAGAHSCGRCSGTGQVNGDTESPAHDGARTAPAPSAAEHAWHAPGSAVRPRVSTLPARNLAEVLPGEWLVELHGYGRILAVMRFTLDRTRADHRFDVRHDYGGPPGWEARGTWTALPPGNTLWFSGTQSSPFTPPSKYHWGATLDAISIDLLRGESISNEPTIWRRMS